MGDIFERVKQEYEEKAGKKDFALIDYVEQAVDKQLVDNESTYVYNKEYRWDNWDTIL